MIDEGKLSKVILRDLKPRLVEPHIYTLNSTDDIDSGYDVWGGVYDLVACNRLYNRLIWGYWVSEYHAFCYDALNASSTGWVLDAGCGSLAFTAGTYLKYSERPVVLMDNSIKMLKLAKSRLIKLNGKVPDNMVFLHGDVLQLPFKSKSFGTIVSLNVLHAVEEAKKMLQGMQFVLHDGGVMSLTTLVENKRYADRYLRKLGEAGALVSRSSNQLITLFSELDIPVNYKLIGNLAFINSGNDSNYVTA